MLFLTESDVRALLPMKEAIALMRFTFTALARGEAVNQPRRRMQVPGGAVLHSMAGAAGSYFGTKIYSVKPKHGAYFLFVLYDASTADPLALMEANHLGQIRTGATSGFATDVLARQDAQTLGVIGSGFQARSQVEAMCAVRDIRRLRVFSRDAQKRQSFAIHCGARFGIDSSAVDTAKEAVSGADIVVTATFSKDPVLESGWVKPGAHVNAMGSNQADRRELPGELLERADQVVVDSIEQSRIEAGDLLLGLKDWTKIQELQNFDGWPQRPNDAITIFKSIGMGVEDVASAAWIYEHALPSGRGTKMLVESPH